jgi:hypothetical protein
MPILRGGAEPTAGAYRHEPTRPRVGLMSTENTTTRRLGGLGIRWYHPLFAIAFGVGAGVLPPDGAVTYAGWLGGLLGSLTSAFVIAGLVLVATRQVDDWRPGELVGHDAPDSNLKYVLFSAISAQLFVLGTALTANVSLGTLVLLISAINPVVGLVVVGDMFRLKGRGIEWDQSEFGLPVAAFLVGIVGGLAYWYRRGRKRAAWVTADTTATAEQAGADAEQEPDRSDADDTVDDGSSGTDETADGAEADSEDEADDDH